MNALAEYILKNIRRDYRAITRFGVAVIAIIIAQHLPFYADIGRVEALLLGYLYFLGGTFGIAGLAIKGHELWRDGRRTQAAFAAAAVALFSTFLASSVLWPAAWIASDYVSLLESFFISG
jgi:hypothetical protein